MKSTRSWFIKGDLRIIINDRLRNNLIECLFSLSIRGGSGVRAGEVVFGGGDAAFSRSKVGGGLG